MDKNNYFYEFRFKAADGQELHVYKWTPKNNNNNVKGKTSAPDDSCKIKGALNIVHGMGEHALRYAEFAEYLNGLGYAVYAMDQRGHGKTAEKLDMLGHQADRDGWHKVIDDIIKLNVIIHKENPSCPLFLFGHSAGSFLVTDLMILLDDKLIISKEKKVDGIILSGTTASPGFMGLFGILLARYFIWRKGPRVKSPLHRALTFGKFNKHFKPNRTNADWTSRDEASVDRVVSDPFCFTIFSAAFYMEMIESTLRVNNFKNINRIPADIPLLFISGTECAVGNYTKGTKKVYRDFVRAGIKDIELKLYPGARHEIINELNRKEVFKDVGMWLEKHEKILSGG